MASINFKELKQNKQNKAKDYIYTDLRLDVETQTVVVSNNSTVSGKDVISDKDEEAIKNSIFNILKTRKGEDILVPEFGCNLLGYLFLPVTETTGRMISREVLNAIRIWEPRVEVTNVFTTGYPDKNEYQVDISINIPVLSKRDIKIIGILAEGAFSERQIL